MQLGVVGLARVAPGAVLLVGSGASGCQIAEELYLSQAAVKTHIRALFERLEVGDLPQNRKRARLVAGGSAVNAADSGNDSDRRRLRDVGGGVASL